MQDLLSVQPEKTIEFPTPAATPVTKTLEIVNLVDENVAYKVKTTAPKDYLVRPSTGVLRPNQRAAIEITLQPMERTANAHKFLVQAVKIQDQEAVSKDFWSNIAKDQMFDKRLNVVFVAAEAAPDHTLPFLRTDNTVEESFAPSASGMYHSVSDMSKKLEEAKYRVVALEKELVTMRRETEMSKSQVTDHRAEIEELRKQLKAVSEGSTAKGVRHVFELWHVIVIVVGVVVALKIIQGF